MTFRAGVCPYVIATTSSDLLAPVPLVVSPSLPAAVDLTVNYIDQTADDLPLNLSTTADCIQRPFQTSVGDAARVPDGQSEPGLVGRTAGITRPPPAHCHVAGHAGGVPDAGLTTDALSRLTSGQWTQLAGCHDDHAGAPATAAGSAEALRSLDVLSAAAALRSQLLDPRRTLVLADGVTSSVTSSVNSYLVGQLMMMMLTMNFSTINRVIGG